MDTKLQAELSVDTSQGEASIDRFGKSVTRMSDSVSRDADRAGKAVDGIGGGADRSAENFSRAERRMADSIKRTTERMELLGKTASEKLEFKLNTQGLDPAKFEPALARLREIETASQRAQQAASGSLNAMGVSAAQTAAALRGVPAQFTDIVVSLSSGQQPMTVLLQQGGQLKDMFGGVGNAARALGGYVAGLVNPFTVAAASAGALFLAYEQGRKESAMLEQSLLKTGNIIGATAGQLNEMAKALDAQGFTRGAAAAALAQIASTGAVATNDLQAFTKVAMDMERLVGVPVEDTAKAFKELGNEPVKAVVKLNESMHFLTMAQYEQIKALEEQGRKTDAARVAQQAYSDALGPMLANARQNIGYLERSWFGVTTAAKEAWDAMLAVGRKDTGEDRLSAARKKLSDMRAAMDWESGTAAFTPAQIQAQQAQVTYLERVIQATKDAAAAQAAYQTAQDEGIEASKKLNKTLEQFATKQQQAKKALKDYHDELDAVRKANPDDPRLDPKAVAAVERQIQEKYKETASVRLTTEQTQIAALKAKIAAEDEAISRLTQYGAAASKMTEGEREVLKLQEQIALATNKKTAAELQAQLAAAQTLAARQKSRQALEEEIKRQEEAAGLQAKFAADLDKSTEAIIAQAAGQERANEVYGRSKAAVADLVLEEMKQNLELERNQAQMPGVIERLEARIAAQQRLVTALREGEVKEASEKSAKDAAAEWKRAAKSIERTLTDSLMRGFESGKGFAQNLRDTVVNMFKTMVLRPVVQAIVQPVAGALTGSLGLSGAANAATGSATSSVAESVLGNVMLGGSSLTAIGSSIGSGFMATISGQSVAAAAEAYSAAGMSGVAAGLQLGSYLPYVGAAMAIYSIAKSLEGGETRAGGKYGWGLSDVENVIGGNYSKTTFVAGPSGGQIESTAVTTAIESTITNINDLLKRAGSTASLIGFQAGLESSGNGKGGVLAGGTLSTGVKFGETGTGSNYAGTQYETFSTQSPDSKQALENFATDLTQATLQALDAANLGGAIGELLAKTDIEALTGDQATQLLASVSDRILQADKLREALDKLPFTNLQNMSLDAADSLIRFSGGLDAVVGGLQSYYQNFYSEAERTANATQSLTDALAGLGIDAVPATREAYRALVESQDLTTESGRKTYAALISLSGAFASVTRDATSIASERYGLETRLLQLQGDTAALREREISTLDQSNQALQRQIWALEDATAAANAAAQAAAAVASERYSLETRLLQLQGDTAALRERELAALDPSNQALQLQIWALEDQAAANERAAASAAEAAQRAQELKSAWQGVTDGLIGEIRRIRGELVGGAADLGVAALQSQFAILTAQARAGDQSAAQQLAGISQSMLTAYKGQASSYLDYARLAGQTAGSLQVTASGYQGSYGVDVPGDIYVSPVITKSIRSSDEMRGMREEMRSQREELRKMNQQLQRIADSSHLTAAVLDDAARGKNPLQTTP